MTTSGAELTGRSLHPGTATGNLVVLTEPLSFWGGVDDEGRIIDAHHPQFGAPLAGRIVAMPAGRGSSSSTAVLAELIRSGHGPAALLLGECDTILLLGALVAAEMYDVAVPVVQLDPAVLPLLRPGERVQVWADAAGCPATAIVGGPVSSCLTAVRPDQLG